MDYAMKSMINQVNKLRISFYAKEGNEVSFLGMYKKLGFEIEGCQARGACSAEGEFLDVYLMGKLID